MIESLSLQETIAPTNATHPSTYYRIGAQPARINAITPTLDTESTKAPMLTSL